MLSKPASILVLTFYLTSALKAVDAQQQLQQGQPIQQDATQSQDQQSFQVPAMDLTPEQDALAREGIRQMLSQVPAQTVEPLFETMDGYCKAFSAICSLTCEEREAVGAEGAEGEEGAQGIEDSAKTESRRVGGCAKKSALSVALAQATCICLGYDLTDRVNFAV